MLQSFATYGCFHPCLSLGSLSERAGVRAKLGGDPEWQAEYFQKEKHATSLILQIRFLLQFQLF